VPNISYTLEKRQGFDLCFEHLQYFSLENLKHLVSNIGMDILSWGFTEDKHDMYVVSIKKRMICEGKQNKIERNEGNSNIFLEFPSFKNKWIAYGLNSNLESILNFTDSTIPEFIIDDSVIREGIVHFGDKKIYCSNSELIKKKITADFLEYYYVVTAPYYFTQICKKIFDINPNAEVRSILSV